MRARTKVTVECDECGATGLYCGFAEAPGQAVVCLQCDGTGRDVITYTPFTKRKPKRGVRTVRRSRGSFIGTGVGGHGRSISYAQFAKGKLP